MALEKDAKCFGVMKNHLRIQCSIVSSEWKCFGFFLLNISFKNGLLDISRPQRDETCRGFNTTEKKINATANPWLLWERVVLYKSENDSKAMLFLKVWTSLDESLYQHSYTYRAYMCYQNQSGNTNVSWFWQLIKNSSTFILEELRCWSQFFPI